MDIFIQKKYHEWFRRIYTIFVTGSFSIKHTNHRAAANFQFFPMARSNRIFTPGNRYLIPFLAFLSAFAPLSTDMFLPALPAMAGNLHTSDELMSYSVSAFLLFFGVSMLFWGPISDRYGRKPALIAGSSLYIISSIAIAAATDIWWLLAWRCVQAIGSGAASAMSLAIVKDILRGALMEKLVSVMQAATILAPITAPILGGAILLVVSWRGIFWCLAICGAIALAGSLLIKETRQGKGADDLAATFARMAVVLGNRYFRDPLFIFSAMAMPFMSYLGVSTFIFQNGFGVSAQSYSFFFALNAGVSLLGPLSHMYIFKRFNRERIITRHMFFMAVFGVLILFFGNSGPWVFTLLFAPITYCGSAMRPPSTILMMQSNPGDNGIVSSMINCGGLLFGSFAMFLASLGFWPNPVIAVGCIAFAVSAICLLAWFKLAQNSRAR